ncbi:MAG: glycosyltransferase [Planctomycetota bacterium]|nr:glycosyltransferase [Planctomycetota bacterium]
MVRTVMRVLHVITDIRLLGGGLAVSVRGLASAQARLGMDVEILSVGVPGSSSLREPGQNGDRQPLLRTFAPAFPRRWGRSPDLAAHIRETASRFDAIHLHGLWRHPVTAGARLLRRIGSPYVITPHGLLNPLALSRRRWTKRPYLALLERQTLTGAGVIHCLSEFESASVRKLGLAKKVVVIPNGLSAAEMDRREPPGFLRQRYPGLRDRRLILYLGRVIREKGVRSLIPALRQLRKTCPDAHLVLAGRCTRAERVRLKMLIAWHGVGDHVSQIGLLSAEEKWRALADADVFVHPSSEEADSMAVLEALASGLPVVLGPGADNHEIRARDIGWAVRPEPEAIASAILDAVRSPDRARETGEAGRRWVRSERSWDRIAPRWLDVYRDLRSIKLKRGG